MKVLLVEDDEQDRHLLEAYVKEIDDSIELEVVADLDGARDAIARNRPDMALLDLGLSRSSGLHTLILFRKAHGEIPVVVLTGLDGSDIGLEAIRRGAQHYLVKGRDEGARIVAAIRSAAGQGSDVIGGMAIHEGTDLAKMLDARVKQARKDNAPLVIATVHTPAGIILQQYGEDDLFVIDATGHQPDDNHPRISIIESPQRFERIASRLEFACRRLGPDTRAVLYALDTFGLYAGPEQIGEFVHGLSNRFGLLGIQLEVIATKDHSLLSQIIAKTN